MIRRNLSYPVLVALLVCFPASSKADTKQRDAACAAEARQLVQRLDNLWPGWAEDQAAAIPAQPGMLSPLIDAAVIGGERELIEASIAQLVADAFRSWSSTVLARPPTFTDGVPPAPEAWVRKALVQLRQKEAGALRAALLAPEAKPARKHATTAARTRFRIIAALLSEQSDAWRHDELQEGLATYTAYHGLRLGAHASYEIGKTMGTYDQAFAYAMAARLRETLIKRLERVEKGQVDLYTPEVSGFAMALILDRIRHGWREELREGWRSLDALLVRQARPLGS